MPTAVSYSVETPAIHEDKQGNPLTSKYFNPDRFDTSYQALQRRSFPSAPFKLAPLPSAKHHGPHQRVPVRPPSHVSATVQTVKVRKVAKVAPTPEPTPEPTPDPSAALSSLTVKVLRKLATTHKVKGRSKLAKPGLVSALAALGVTP